MSRVTEHLSRICRRCIEQVSADILEQCEKLNADHGDPSVMDIFRYYNILQAGRPEGNMGSHFDPGLLTLKPVSKVPGLDVLDRVTGEWVDAESIATPGKCLLLFVGETLELLTEGNFKACSHRVHTETHHRLSVVYEMRSHHV